MSGIDTSSPREWSHPTPIGCRDNCPKCTYSGFGHVTVFVGQQIGRRCLECASTWPIIVPQEEVK